MQNSSIFSGSIKFSSMSRWKYNFLVAGGSINGVGGRVVLKLGCRTMNVDDMIGSLSQAIWVVNPERTGWYFREEYR